MGDVVDIKTGKKPQLLEEAEVKIWQCNCNCVTFRLYVGGEIRCAGCSERIIGLYFISDIDV